MLGKLLDRSVVFDFDRTGYERHARRFIDEPTRPLGPVLMTGGTAGIGLAAAEALAQAGAEMLLWARNPERGAHAAERTGGVFVPVDLGDLEAVAAASEDITHPVDVVLNAGAMPLERTLSAQGHELIWASQVLGHTLLLHKLHARQLLRRVVWVSSGGAYTQQLDLRDLPCEQGYQRHSVYANAKRAQLELNALLAELWPEVHLAAMHPGWVDTAAVQHSMPWFRAVTRPILRTPEQGADTIVWLVTRPEPGPSGRFWFDRAEVPVHRSRSTHTRPGDAEALLNLVRSQIDGF